MRIYSIRGLSSYRRITFFGLVRMPYFSRPFAKSKRGKEPYMTKSEIMDGLSEACKDIKLMREGKLKGRPIEELLNEL